jgi:hypothetical protein
VRGVVCTVLAVGLAGALVGTAVVGSALSLAGVGPGAMAPDASTAARATIPTGMLVLYQAASATCPGLPWTVLAAIGTVESDNDQSTLPGVHSGANAAGAEVICGCYRALWHVRHEALGGRGSLVSDGCEPRGPLDGHTGFVGCRSHDGQLSGVACGVAF